ncbi:protein-L-isoaspartate(D-aspartate) O-methyltransferase [Aquabacter spiritensis]|uniref:Protein-L-isoaspartate O-methyltransferase n=1 Tax=Aquabacter spiritensis TaxID=933073 RepID=A0A4R3LSQ7_9HYPH|nr:protein-L-isoaspartate(D-aspartate) O-methyltransferase [Aquabacter spiritensis]TCT02876.1 protein-L-isoaspartate(D-aspartate) O-methyltransferase [Aquabacter spiritensis]
MSDRQDEDTEIAAFLRGLHRRGIRDPAVLRAMELVPRALFVEPGLRRHAYDDVALPIACGQTISQPSLVAEMTEALQVTAGHRVLEVGTGSGYQAAILSHLAADVVTVDRYRSLVAEAQVRFQELGLRNVSALVADGRGGMPSRAPYDRIMVTAATREVPPALFEQLRIDGLLVAPVGDPASVQDLTRYAKGVDGISATRLCAVRFVPLLEGVSARL